MAQRLEVSDLIDDWNGWRAQRDTGLVEPFGPLTIASIHYLGPDPQRFAGIPGRWSSGPEGPVVALDDAEELIQGGTPIRGRHALGPVPPGRPVLFERADTRHVRVELLHQSGWDIVRLRDNASPLRLGYRGTPAFDFDLRWRVEGSFTPVGEERTVRLESVAEPLGRDARIIGEVGFELAGRAHRLLVFPSRREGIGAVLFRDASSGITSYAASRELQIELPPVAGTVVLDFNRAYNKPCAYTDFAICPLPPADNILPIAIEAGEKTPYERLAPV